MPRPELIEYDVPLRKGGKAKQVPVSKARQTRQARTVAKKAAERVAAATKAGLRAEAAPQGTRLGAAAAKGPRPQPTRLLMARAEREYRPPQKPAARPAPKAAPRRPPSVAEIRSRTAELQRKAATASVGTTSST